METYFIYMNGKHIDEVVASVDGMLMDVLLKWLTDNGYEERYKLFEQTKENECSAKINDNLYFTIKYYETVG